MDSTGVSSDKRRGYDGIQSENAPSRVIHFRNVASEMNQHDFISIAQPFGPVEQVLMLKSKNQCLLQFNDMGSAIQFMQLYGTHPLNIRGRNVYPQFSSHQELNSQSGMLSRGAPTSSHHDDGSGSSMSGTPNRILLVTIHNAMYPITVDVLHQVFGPHGLVEKIVIFNKAKGLQALIQYANVQSATTAKEVLQDQNIYTNGSCQLHIQFSNLPQELTVTANTDKTKDFTKALPEQPRFVHAQHPAAHQHQQQDFYAQQQPYGAFPVSMGFINTQQFNCVLLVSNLAEAKVTPTVLFNLFSNYGNVIRVKVLHNKPDHALVQMGDYFQASTAMQFLKGLTLFDKQIDINFSKHAYITANDPSDPTCADFSNSPLNRFKRFAAGSEKAHQIYKHMAGPSPLLHVSNLSPTTTEESLQQLFAPFGPITLKLFEYNEKKQALVHLSSIQAAAESLVLLHNTNVDGRGLKVSFSKNKL